MQQARLVNMPKDRSVDLHFFAYPGPALQNCNVTLNVNKKLYEEFAVIDPHQHRQLGFIPHFLLNFFCFNLIK